MDMISWTRKLQLMNLFQATENEDLVLYLCASILTREKMTSIRLFQPIQASIMQWTYSKHIYLKQN